MGLRQEVSSLLVFLLLIAAPPIVRAAPEMKGKVRAESGVLFELEFIAGAELGKIVNYLRAQGIAGEIKENSSEIIEVEGESYNKSIEKLSYVVPSLPDITKLVWKNGPVETILFEAHEANISINKDVLPLDQKVLTDAKAEARMTLILKDDKKSVIKYQSVVKRLESLGYKVTFAEGYRDAGWTEYPAIDISIPNKINAFTEAILKLSEISEISRFIYNRGSSPHANEYIATFQNGFDMELQIARFLANGIEVYKVDKLLNRIFIHFPRNEIRNKIKLDQIRLLEDFVILKNIHENNEQFKNEEYSRNKKNVWLDVPESVLQGQWKNDEYRQRLNEIAKGEVEKLQAKGMVVIHFGVYEETGEILIPELVFTHLDKDFLKADEILREHDKNPYRAQVNACSALFN